VAWPALPALPALTDREATQARKVPTEAPANRVSTVAGVLPAARVARVPKDRRVLSVLEDSAGPQEHGATRVGLVLPVRGDLVVRRAVGDPLAIEATSGAQDHQGSRVFLARGVARVTAGPQVVVVPRAAVGAQVPPAVSVSVASVVSSALAALAVLVAPEAVAASSSIFPKSAARQPGGGAQHCAGAGARSPRAAALRASAL